MLNKRWICSLSSLKRVGLLTAYFPRSGGSLTDDLVCKAPLFQMEITSLSRLPYLSFSTPSILSSTHPSTYLPSLSTHPSSIHPSACPSIIHLSVHPHNYPLIHLSIHLSIHPAICHPFIYPIVHLLFIYPPIRISTHSSICPSINPASKHLWRDGARFWGCRNEINPIYAFEEPKDP